MPRSSVTAPPVGALLRRYEDPGEPLSCERVSEGLLNRGYRLSTTRGAYFLKHHLDGDREVIARQHRATQRLQALGVPVAPPVADAHGETVAVIGDRCYALHPWVEGRHRDGAQLSSRQSRRLGSLLGLVHTCLERVMHQAEPPTIPRPRSRPPAPPSPRRYTRQYAPQHSRPYDSADPTETFALIDELLALARGSRPHDTFDTLAEHRLLERRALLERYADRRPPPAKAGGWVHEIGRAHV